MTRCLLLIAAVAGCTTSAPAVTRGEGEAQHVTVGTISAPSPVARLAATPRPTPSKASRTRALPGLTASGSGSLLNWAALRDCENSGSYRSKPTDHYRGAYQFDYMTWRSVGGTGDPAAASPAEQDMRARLLYKARGRSPWPVCGRRL